MFPCNQWFDKKEHDGKIERDLFPEEHKKLTHKDYRDLLGSKTFFICLNFFLRVIFSIKKRLS